SLPRYDTTSVVTGSIQLPADRYQGPGDRLAFFDQVEARLAALPWVDAFSFATALPGTGAPDAKLEIDGRPAPDGKAPTVWTLSIGRRYFDTIGVALLPGRPVHATDGSTGAGAAIVNERLVELFFKDRDAIGQRIRLLPSTGQTAVLPPWLTIAGVAPTPQQRLAVAPDPMVYVPLRGAPPPAV